jgi:hypothetical protein
VIGKALGRLAIARAALSALGSTDPGGKLARIERRRIGAVDREVKLLERMCRCGDRGRVRLRKEQVRALDRLRQGVLLPALHTADAESVGLKVRDEHRHLGEDGNER